MNNSITVGNSIIRDGLLVYLNGYDSESFAGEPTENFVPEGMRTCETLFSRNGSHASTESSYVYSTETKIHGRDNAVKIVCNPAAPQHRIAVLDFRRINPEVRKLEIFYAISFDYKMLDDPEAPYLSNAYANGYKNPDGNVGTFSPNTLINLGDGWIRKIRTATINAAGNIWWWNGSIGAFKIYERVLSDDEINNNFLVMKGRYNV